MQRSVLMGTVAVSVILALAGGTAATAAALEPSNRAATVEVKRCKKSSSKACAKKTPSATAKGSAKSVALPADACKLLTMDEVHGLAPKVDAAEPASESQPVAEVRCHWSYTGSDLDFNEALKTVELTVSQVPSSVPDELLKLSFQAEIRDGAKEVSGIGDRAIVRSVISSSMEVKAIVGRVYVNLEYSGNDAQSKQDAVVALAKTAAGRL